MLVYDGPQGKIDGIMIGRVGEYFFSNELGAYDVAFYVRRERRGSIVAHRLWRTFLSWARAQGAVHTWPEVAAGIDPARGARFFRGLGLQEIGAVFFGRIQA